MIRVDEKRRRIEASFLDDFLKGLSKSMIHGLADMLEQGARNLVGWSLARIAFSVVAIGITIAASVFLLIAGIEGLKEAAVPPPLAYLAGGFTGLAAGLVLFKLKG